MFFANQEEWKKISAFSFVKEALGDLDGWQIFEAEGTLEGNELGEFTVDGKMRIFGKIDIWAVQLRGALTFQLYRHTPTVMFGFKNTGIDLVQVGGDKFFASGTINGALNILPECFLSGSMLADIYIPDLFKNHPGFQLVNSKLGLPLKVASTQLMVRGLKASFDLDLGWLGVWNASIDYSKNAFTQPTEFIGIHSGSAIDLGGIAFKMNDKKVQANDTTFVPFTLNTPANYAYAEIKANVQPSTFLVSPTQKIYTSTSVDSAVIFSPAASTADVGLWVLKNPELGQWKLGVVGKKTGDSIHFWAIVKQRPEFSFTSNQIARTVFCNWDNSKATDSSIVDFFIDTDDNGNDGYRIGTVDEKKGSFSYTMTDSLKECGYYIYAVRWDRDRATNFVYSPTLLSNLKVALPAPMNLSGIYTNKNIVTLSWAKSTDPTTTIYLIKVTDETGKDSIYASTNPYATGIQLEVVNAGTKTFSIQTQGLNQSTGCWAKFPKLTLGAEEEPLIGFENSMEIIPNPTEANALVRFKQSSYDKVKVVVVDLLGREVLHIDGGFKAEGIHSMQLDLSHVEQGVYFVQVVSGSNRASTIMTVIR
ncbi:MAG: T9SS type A sorting domain-containing protein [Ignavibacteria bacterium]|nr:T9SS type A sorting domain-containing protein [Ignavibacteria bacterium]